MRVQVGKGEGPEGKLIYGEGDNTASCPVVERGEAFTPHNAGQAVKSPLQASQISQKERQNNRKRADDGG